MPLNQKVTPSGEREGYFKYECLLGSIVQNHELLVIWN